MGGTYDRKKVSVPNDDDFQETQQGRKMAFSLINIRFILLISASFIAIFSSIAIYFCLPLLISHVIRTQITLSASSGSFNQWRTNSVIDRVYLFNITNIEDLSISAANSNEKRRTVPRLKEIGPFSYRQDREKLNINFDRQNETVLYDQKKSWQFLPEISISKTSSDMDSLWISHINVPLAGTTVNPEYAEFVEPVILENDLKLFLQHSANNLLFDGYHDILMEQAKSSGQIDTDRFGWMHNLNNTLTKSIRVFTGPSNATLNKFGFIDEFDHKRQFRVWHNNNTEPNDYREVKCNQFRFSSAGEFFPPPEYSFISHNHLDRLYGGILSSSKESLSNEKQGLNKSERKSISLFMPDLCRTIRLFYNGSHEHRGLSVDRYIANEDTYRYYSQLQEDQAANEFIESNRCFCLYDDASQKLKCPPNGMMDLFHCRQGSPITISFPHFLYSKNDPTLEPYLRLFEIEQSNNNDKDDRSSDEAHQFFIDLETTLNIPVKAQIVLQFNVHLRNEMDFTKAYSFLFQDPAREGRMLNDIYLPQMWIKSTAEIDDANLNNLRFIQRHLGLVTPLSTIMFFGCASILLLASAKLAYDLTYGPHSRKSIACDEESCSSSNHQNHLCSTYLDETKKKKKYMNLQLLSGEKEATKTGCCDKNSSLSSSGSKLVKPPFGYKEDADHHKSDGGEATTSTAYTGECIASASTQFKDTSQKAINTSSHKMNRHQSNDDNQFKEENEPLNR